LAGFPSDLPPAIRVSQVASSVHRLSPSLVVSSSQRLYLYYRTIIGKTQVKYGILSRNIVKYFHGAVRLRSFGGNITQEGEYSQIPWFL
jgi:hypothetical protein